MKYLRLFLAIVLLGFSQIVSANTYPITDKSQVPAGGSWNGTQTIYTTASDTYILSVWNGGGGWGAGASLPTNATSNGWGAQYLIDNGEGIWFFDKLKAWDVGLDDIPKIIVNLVEFLLGIAGAISVVVIIYWALQMQLNSGIMGKSDDKWRKIIMGGIVGFILSISSWFIITKFVEIISDR